MPTPLSAVLTGQGLLLLDVTAEHAESIRDYPELTRHDPFDRLLSPRLTAPACDCSPLTEC